MKKIYIQTYNNNKKKKIKIKNKKNYIHLCVYIPAHAYTIMKIQKYIKEKDLTWMIIHYI